MQGKVGTSNFVHKVLNEHNLHAKKKFGQNFITDQNILSTIIDAAELNETIAVIEIGPGLGSLTERLCKACGFVLCYELSLIHISEPTRH